MVLPVPTEATRSPDLSGRVRTYPIPMSVNALPMIMSSCVPETKSRPVAAICVNRFLSKWSALHADQRLDHRRDDPRGRHVGRASRGRNRSNAHNVVCEKAFEAVTLDLSKPAGNVVSLSRSCPKEFTMRTTQEDAAADT